MDLGCSLDKGLNSSVVLPSDCMTLRSFGLGAVDNGILNPANSALSAFRTDRRSSSATDIMSGGGECGISVG